MPLTDVADVMLTQSGKKVNHVRSKGHVSALLLTSCFGVVYFKVDAFRKEYNNVNFMGMISKDDCMALA